MFPVRLISFALLLALGPIAVPAFAAAPCADPTIEIHCDHPDIVAKAGELETPLAIYKFVRNTIEYEVYYGSRKGALGTLWSGAGNDMDQASLLIALLRAAGYNARYVIGMVNVDFEQLKQWSGIHDAAHARTFFKQIYCPGGNGPCATDPLRFSQIPGGVMMERTWVEVELPRHYRGEEIAGSPMSWIPLDPSWKRKGLPEVGDLLDLPLGDEASDDCAGKICFDYDDYYSKLDPRLASEIWERQLQEYIAQDAPGRSVEDLVYDGPIIPYEGEVLPATLPFLSEPEQDAGDPETSFPATAGPIRVNDFDDLPPGLSLRSYVTITLCCDYNAAAIPPYDVVYWRKSFVAAELVGKRVVLSFEPKTDSVRKAVLANGGYLGGYPSNPSYNSLFDYCVATHSVSDCAVNPVIRVDGEISEVFETFEDYPLGTTWELYVSATASGGTISGSSNAQSVIFGSDIALAVDLNNVGAGQIRTRMDHLLDSGETLPLLDETTYADDDDDDPNHNGIPGEVLVDQGTNGPDGVISECPDYGAAEAATTCDIAVGAHPAVRDELLGELLNLAALRYFQRLREELKRQLAPIREKIQQM